LSKKCTVYIHMLHTFYPRDEALLMYTLVKYIDILSFM